MPEIVFKQNEFEQVEVHENEMKYRYKNRFYRKLTEYIALQFRRLYNNTWNNKP
jgi:hypothetical protein